MSERVTMPALGESVTEGTVTRWLKSVGDRVEVDEPLLEVSTDKVDTEIPSPVAGTLQEILVQEDDTVPVGADLAVIGDGAESSGSDGGSDGASETSSEPPAGGSAPAAPAQADAEPEAGEPVQQQQAEPEPAAESTPASEPEPSEPASSSSGSGEGTTVSMPALGESVTEGTVTRWLKSVGDTVEVDEPLLEVSTDKVDTEIPSPVAGTLSSILVQEDETVPVGADLAVVGGAAQGGDSGGAAESADTSEQSPTESDAASERPSEPGQSPSDEGSGAQASQDEPSAPEPKAESASEPKAESAPEPKAESASEPTPDQSSDAGSDKPPAPTPATDVPDASAYVTPLVRKIASDNDIDLATVTGTGVGGRVRKQDVLAVVEERKKAAEKPAEPAQAPQQAPASAEKPAAQAASAEDGRKRGTTEKMTRLRRMIAQRMVQSLQVSAQLTTVVEVDVTKISRLRARAKDEFEKREGVKLSFLPFFALAAVEALKAHPSVNASIDDDEVTYHGVEHLGMAVDTPKGLIVPVIKNAGDLSIAGLAKGIADLAERTRTNKIGPDELSGGTFTITNTGSRGALFDTPIINQPQVAILGTGAVVKRPVVVTDRDGGETIAIRAMVYLALSYDHRIVDGADAARFLTTMKNRLEEGAFEASLGL